MIFCRQEIPKWCYILLYPDNGCRDFIKAVWHAGVFWQTPQFPQQCGRFMIVMLVITALRPLPLHIPVTATPPKNLPPFTTCSYAYPELNGLITLVQICIFSTVPQIFYL